MGGNLARLMGVENTPLVDAPKEKVLV